jgi:hypothetical protein
MEEARIVTSWGLSIDCKAFLDSILPQGLSRLDLVLPQFALDPSAGCLVISREYSFYNPKPKFGTRLAEESPGTEKLRRVLATPRPRSWTFIHAACRQRICRCCLKAANFRPAPCGSSAGSSEHIH